MTQPNDQDLSALLRLPAMSAIPEADLRATFVTSRRRAFAVGAVAAPEGDEGGPALLISGRLAPQGAAGPALNPGAWLLPGLSPLHQASAPAVLLFPGVEAIRRWARLSHALAVALVEAQIGASVAARGTLREALAEPRLIEQIDRQMSRCRRDGRPVVVARIVPDGPAVGVAAGAETLLRVEEAIAKTVRPNDGFGRFGADGFLLSLAGVGQAEAAAVVLRLHAAADGSAADAPLSFSTGLAGIRADDTVDAAIARAGDALKRARTMGRNCFSF